MKIKSLLFSLFIAMGCCLVAVNPLKKPKDFPFFIRLPYELQNIIITRALAAPSPLVAVKRLAKLRQVSKSFKAYIEGSDSGKELMRLIAEQFPQDKQALFNAAYQLYTPGSVAWLKKEVAIDPAFSKIVNDEFVNGWVETGEKFKFLLSYYGLAEAAPIWEPNKIDFTLAAGADVNSSRARIVLMDAINDGRLILVRKMLAAGLNPNTITSTEYIDSATPLIWATARGMNGIVQELIKDGANVNYAALNQRTKKRQTALDIAIETIRPSTVQILRAHGAKTAEELEKSS